MKKLKQTMKRIATLGLTAALLVNTVPLDAFAADPAGAGGNVSIEAEASYPAFVQSETVDGVKITIGAEEGVFPEGAVLSAEKVTKTREEEALEAVEEERPEEQNVAASYTYDIKVLDKDGNEVQPADESKVKVSFKLEEVSDSNLETNIYHIKEVDSEGAASGEKSGNDKADSEEISDGSGADSDSKVSENTELIAEKLTVETEGDTATAETDGFSLYTVEFTYKDLQYVMPGDSEIALSEILNIVGLTGEVTNVEVSSPELFSTGKSDSGEWIVTARRAFSSEEWMKITINGKEYRITVTDDQEISPWAVLQTQLTNASEDKNNPTEIILSGNVTAGTDDSKLEIPAGRYVTLDLNGHTIDRGLKDKTSVNGGNVITVDGTLTLIDSSADGTGRLTGGNNRDEGGGVYVKNGGTFTMKGGSISACSATGTNDAYGGGVYVETGGTFTMEGGSISACSATGSQKVCGGGVYSNGTFTMSGGSISACAATGTGDNASANGGGVYVDSGKTINVSGTPVISGNMHQANDLATQIVDNVFLSSGSVTATVTVTAALGEDASIGVCPGRSDNIVIARGTDSYVISAGDAEKFHHDATTYNTLVRDVENGKYVIRQEMLGSWSELQAKLQYGGNTVRLDSDYTAGNSDTALVVPAGRTVTLDLNDHYILYKGTGSAPVITVNGGLTLKDSKTPKTTRYITLADGRATGVSESGTLSDTCIEVTGGFIAGGNNESNKGGGVYVEESCRFTMEGGTIVGCKALYGGGVNVNNSGMFTMEGGMIAGCKALYGGGGVFVNNSGNFYMNGGGITNCTATGSGDTLGGGGVYVSTSGKFNMESGSITNCTATSQGGGVYVYGGTFKVSGTPVISGNKKGDKTNNVVLNDSKTITVTGALTEGAEIRVSGAKGKVIAKPDTGYILTANDVAKLHSDDTSLSPGLYGGNVELKETLPTATLSSATMVYNGSAFSPTISFGGATLENDTDYTLSYKKVVNTEETSLSSAPKDAGSYKLVVTGKGGYAGKKELDFIITQKPVTVVSGITVKDKEYDGATTAELITTGAVFEGKCDGDTLTVSDAGAGTFADKDAGASKDVNIDATKFVLGGASAGNYELANSGHQSTATGRISKKSITITGVTANDKEYDGNTTATTNTSHATVTGLVGADTVEFTVDGTFADANKRNNKTVTLSNWNLTSGGTNYEIDAANSQTTTTASITGVQVYITGISAQNKVYDGNKTAAVTGTAILKKVNGDDPVSGLTVSDITAEFEDKNAGDNKTVTITGGTLSDAENYTLVPERTTGLSASITPASVTITGVFADNKTYDGSTAATVTGTPVINGKIGSDVVTVSVGTATFDDANAGDNKTVTFSGFGLTGTDSGNYQLSSQPANVTASITKATPEITQIPTAGAITYGQTLADSTITGGLVKVGETAIEGSFAWKTGMEKPSVADSDKTLYDVVFTPSDTMNYETAECKITLIVNKADIPSDKITPPTANSLNYTGSAQELINPGAVSDGLGTMKYAFAKVSDTDNLPAAPTEEAAYNSSVPTAIKGGNYCIWYMVKGDANHKDKTPASIPVTISKADSKSEEMKTIEVQTGYDVPVSVNLKAYLGENASTSEITTEGTLTFSDIQMEADHYTLSFKATSATGGTGSIHIQAVTENYQDYRIEIPVEAKAITTEVKLVESPNVPTAVEGVEVSGLDAYTDEQRGTTVKVELDVKTENGPVDATVAQNISDTVALIFSGVEGSNVKKEYLDISVKKTVDGTTSTVTDVGSVIEIAVKYDLSGKFNPVVIREHDGNITKFTALTGKPTSDFSDGTFYVDATTGTIYIYTRFFSTYSIAYATVGTCTVSFDAQGGSAVDPIVVQEGGTIPADKIPVSTKSGYSFDGWFTEPSSGEKLTASTVINRDIYYAHWSSNATPPTPPSPTYYTVSFDMNGHGTTIPSQTIESGKTVTKPTDPTAEGFVFTNWYNEASCKNVYDFSTPVTADITLYAGWEVKTEPGPGPDPIIVDGGATWNLYEDASVHEFKIRGINVSGTVANSNAKSKTYYDAKISGSTITVKVTGDRKKAASNATLEFDLGNAGVATYVLPVSYVKPSFKLSSTTATIKSGTETLLKTTILTKNSDGIFEPYDMTDVKVSGTGLGTVTKAEDGSIEIKTKAAGKGKINIVKDAWDGAKPVSLAYTVKSSKKDVLSVDLQGLKTVVVNSNAKGQVLSFDMMLNGAVPAEGVVKIVDKKNTGLATIGKGGKLIVAFNDGVKNGTYTITLQAGEAKTNVKVKVSDKALDKAVTAKVQTKYDVVTRQGMVVIPVLKDVSGTIEAVSVAESGFFANLDAAGNIVIDYTGNKYNLKNLNIGTLTLSLKLNGIDEPVKLTLNNVKAKKTTPTVKAGTVTIPKDAETAEGKVIGTANIVSTYRVISGIDKTIRPVKAEIVGTPRFVMAKVNENDITEIDIYSISKKSVSFKVKLTYAGGMTKTVTVKVNKK